MKVAVRVVSLLASCAVATLLYTVFDQHELKAQQILSAPSSTRSPNQQYEIVQLPSQYATNYGAKGINNKEQIVGSYAVPPNISIVHATLWQNGVLIDLGTLGGSVSIGLGINNKTEVVGSSETGSGTTHAFRWIDGTMTDLGTLGTANSAAFAINNRGQIVGSLSFPSPLNVNHAVLWDDGRIIDLGTGPFTSASAYDINDYGQIVGLGTLPSNDNHAFLWEKGVMTDLGTLGGNISGATGINNRGQIVGYSTTSVGYFLHAVLWERDSIKDLGTPDSDSQAFGINESGEIVGRAQVPSTNSPVFAFVWKDGVLNDLGTIGGVNATIAHSINDRGQIVGVANGPGVYQPLLWNPHEEGR